jgi:hypothetical protein
MTTSAVSYTISAKDQYSSYLITCTAYQDCSDNVIKGSIVVSSTPTGQTNSTTQTAFVCNEDTNVTVGNVTLTISWSDVCQRPVLSTRGSTLQSLTYSAPAAHTIQCPPSLNLCSSYPLSSSGCLKTGVFPEGDDGTTVSMGSNVGFYLILALIVVLLLGGFVWWYNSRK